MNRYEKAFEACRRDNRIAFIPFAIAGDPDIRTSEQVFRTYMRTGADIIEIGYPFSDPIADGPVNQRAAQRAIAAGIYPGRFFAMVRRLRSETDIPFGLLLYANTVYHIGTSRFCACAAAAGIDSVLVADMPPEEARALLPEMKRHGLRSVFIVSELTSPERIDSICRQTDGFVYVVSRLGTTGVRKEVGVAVHSTLKSLRSLTTLPLCVGFGISSPAHVASVRDAGADGVIVGSRLVGIIEQNLGDARAMTAALERSLRAFRKATFRADG
jgi:tryptophan synthase alpha chain